MRLGTTLDYFAPLGVHYATRESRVFWERTCKILHIVNNDPSTPMHVFSYICDMPCHQINLFVAENEEIQLLTSKVPHCVNTEISIVSKYEYGNRKINTIFHAWIISLFRHHAGNEKGLGALTILNWEGKIYVGDIDVHFLIACLGRNDVSFLQGIKQIHRYWSSFFFINARGKMLFQKDTQSLLKPFCCCFFILSWSSCGLVIIYQQ